MGDHTLTRTAIDPVQLAKTKVSFSLRRVNLDDIKTLVSGEEVKPRSGDIVLARFDLAGQHKNLQLCSGRRSRLFPSDTVLVAYGNRYAPDQFEALVPSHLGPCSLVAGGGIASEVIDKSGKVRPASKIQPLGLAADADGRVLNLSDYAVPDLPWVEPKIPLLAVAGTAMNAGKTETVINLTRGLSNAGLRVGVIKVTGTGSGGDIWAAVDAGGAPVLDFTDAGLASTYHVSLDDLEHRSRQLISHTVRSGVDAIVIELADGLYQQETSALLTSNAFTSMLSGLVFAAGDAMGAVAGVDWLRKNTQINVIGIGGVLTMSPMAMREAGNIIGLPVLDLKSLNNADVAMSLLQLEAEAATGTG